MKQLHVRRFFSHRPVQTAFRLAPLFALALAFMPALAERSAHGQAAPLIEVEVPHRVDSGFLDAPPADAGADADEAQVIFSTVLHGGDTPWSRVYFRDVVLSGSREQGNASFLRITSIEDGAQQILDHVSIEQWQNTSAYFNGPTLLLEMLAYPGTGVNRVHVDSLVIDGQPGFFEMSICFGEDERELSNDPRDARLAPVGCTAYLFNEQHRCLLTAGHCTGGGLQVVQFNVPLSNPDGSWNHPPPEDQYAVDPASIQAAASNCSSDWGYFGVFDNSNTGLTPLQVQKDSYVLSDFAPPVSGQMIRIRGYGTVSSPVPPEWNSVQKEHSGSYVVMNNTLIRYQVDTTGGNSGSAVYNHDTGEVIGIHTCAGCHSSGGSNRGTAIHHPGLQSALANPQGICAEPPPMPSNNSCETLMLVDEGSHAFDNIDATTTGPAEPDHCSFLGDDDIQSDVWFGHITQCEGELTIALCESSFATKLGVYSPSCPEGPGEIIACDLMSCPDNARSMITIPVSKFEPLRIRVGGHNGAQGEGILTITCEPFEPETCPGDLTGSGTVGVEDLLILIGSWGSCDECSDCPADLTEQCSVGIDDLLILIGNWGTCDG